MCNCCKPCGHPKYPYTPADPAFGQGPLRPNYGHGCRCCNCHGDFDNYCRYGFLDFRAKCHPHMGCGINHGNKINVQTEVFIPTKKSNDSIETKNSFNRLTLNNISKKNWLKIIDYLQYQELKEVAKTNRMLNYLSKDDKILIKFFQKKNDNIYYKTPKSINTSFIDNTSVQNIIDGIMS
jgi:hypothetical protein